MGVNINNMLSVREIEQITHKLLCRDLGISASKFNKKEPSIFDEIGVKKLK